MERTTRSTNFFKKFSVICNILPYFGYLDQNYQMMSQLSQDSRRCWKDNEAAFCLKALTDRRREMVFSFTEPDKANSRCASDIIKFLKSNPIVYKIFKLPAMKFTSEGELGSFLKFADSINNEFLRFTSVNFDDSKLEYKFHEEYCALLDSKGLEEKKKLIHNYYSSKGVIINLNAIEKVKKVDLSVPQTMAIVLMTPGTDVTDELLEGLDPELKQNITSLGINYLKHDNDYMEICHKSRKLIEWFDEIKHLKFNFLKAPASCVNNIVLNLHDVVTESLEIKVNQNFYSKTSIEAKNCLLMTCFFNTQQNENERKIFKAKRVSYSASPEGLNLNTSENWQKICDFSSLKIEFLTPKEEDEREAPHTNYFANIDQSYFLVDKMSITSATSTKFFQTEVLEQFPNALFKFDITKENAGKVLKGGSYNMIDDYDEDIPFHLISSERKFKEIEPILDQFSDKRLISLEIQLSKSDSSNEVVAVQKIHQMIQNSTSLLEIEMAVHEQASVISILDSCENKPDIDYIKIACSEDLSKQVRKHVKEYKRRNIFKSIRIFVSEAKKEKSKCNIF